MVAMSVLWSFDTAITDGWMLFTIRMQAWIDVENNGYRWDLVEMLMIDFGAFPAIGTFSLSVFS